MLRGECKRLARETLAKPCLHKALFSRRHSQEGAERSVHTQCFSTSNGRGTTPPPAAAGPAAPLPLVGSAATDPSPNHSMAAVAVPGLDALLAACLSTDNQVLLGAAIASHSAGGYAQSRHCGAPVLQVRRQAEEALRRLSHRPDVIPQLVQQLQSAADPHVRQLAAVLLRKWTRKHWDKLPAQVGGARWLRAGTCGSSAGKKSAPAWQRLGAAG